LSLHNDCYAAKKNGMTDAQNVLHWLDSVRVRRSMYIRTISELETMVQGYYAALDTHHISESGPQLTQGHFGVWLRETTGWSLSAGWAYAIEHNTQSHVDVFDHFFSLVDQYRLLTPMITAKVTLKPHHKPTGKRRKYGHDKLMDRPDEILAVNYAPTSLNHLRHRYGDRSVDDWFLMLGNGSHETSLSDLVYWVSEEFGVDQSEWNFIAESTA
jgi:hypothetical protein